LSDPDSYSFETGIIMKKTQMIIGAILILATLSSCGQIPQVSVAAGAANLPLDTIQSTPTALPPLPTPVVVNHPSTTGTSSQVMTNAEQDEINPLTGLPVDNPDYLKYSPILVSVSNFPVSVRPQSGLSFAPHVFEMTIGEGMTRFLAVYYGSYGPPDKQTVNLGSVRSGRLPYEQIRTMYNGLIVMAGAAPEVGTQLNATVYRQTISFDGIKGLAEDRSKLKGAPDIAPSLFSTTIAAGGQDGSQLDITWSRLNLVRWTYDAASGKYLRFQDKADGKSTYYPATDKLTGEQMAADNVVLMAVEHNYLSPTKIELNLLYVKKEPAIFFRDGKAYKIYWSSLAPLGSIKFFNEDGTPFAYKPGNTWYEIISSMDEVAKPDTGIWKVRFFNPY
jgi:hypothetical protein